MCGIFSIINNSCSYNDTIIAECFNAGIKRGPESSILTKISSNVLFGFHRLAINGLNTESNQPMMIDNICLICNGEIYNFKELFIMLNIRPQTNSDCEIIIHLYKKYGIEYTLYLLDGYFSFILYDMSNIYEEPYIYIARDPYGVRPLYILQPDIEPTNNYNNVANHETSEKIIAFASELKMLNNLFNINNKTLVYKNNEYRYNLNPTSQTNTYYNYSIQQYPPGTYSKLKRTANVNSNYTFEIYAKSYTGMQFCETNHMLSNTFSTSGEYYSVYNNVYTNLCEAVKKRVVGTTDRPIACLLSGGLDSSLIAALVSQYYNKPLETYSIGMPGGEDLRYARLVSEHIGSKHTEIIISEEEFFRAIPEVIKVIESYDTTTVRASVGNYLVSKFISENSNAKVIFNGDGSDELTGGYLYFHSAPDVFAFDCEVKRLLNDIHLFDVLRSDKSISSNGLEPRTPFLDRDFVQSYLSIPLKFRYNPNKIEKWLLRQSVSVMNNNLLPHEVLWRIKEAFSDGVSSQSRSWFQIISDNVANMDFDSFNNITHLPPKTNEQKYYRKIFDELYPNCSNVIPYFWMPRFVNATDASARTLNYYTNM